ncbi:MAG: hypothetical protein E6J06_13545 [Chloroflexi bacterium]|nr:MAG: hypothetical protein E6J06_13545 [Chloroflexota bacterium]
MSEVFRVLRPGLLTTIQDIGRPHAVASGVPAGGAMDRFAHAAANLIVGNDRTAATLECTLSGPHLVAERSCLVAITGADFEPRVNGVPAPMWTGLFLSPADELTFGGRRSGARAYVAVAGGIAGERWLGSMSTNLMCARGGMNGRALVAGDLISAGEASGPAVAGRNLAEALQPVYGERILRAIPGPHFARLPGQPSLMTPIGWATGSKVLDSKPLERSCCPSAWSREPCSCRRAGSRSCSWPTTRRPAATRW